MEITLHSDYGKMSNRSHIKIKILSGLLIPLEDFKNILIPPRMLHITTINSNVPMSYMEIAKSNSPPDSDGSHTYSFIPSTCY